MAMNGENSHVVTSNHRPTCDEPSDRRPTRGSYACVCIGLKVRALDGMMCFNDEKGGSHYIVQQTVTQDTTFSSSIFRASLSLLPNKQ